MDKIVLYLFLRSKKKNPKYGNGKADRTAEPESSGNDQGKQ